MGEERLGVSHRRLGPRDPAVTSRMMSRVRAKDSKAELAIRRELHRRGIRYRLHAKDVLGKPDLVWRGRRLAVFIDSDFWHGNPQEWQRRGLASMRDMFPSRTEWWLAKIERTCARDEHVTEGLRQDGWTVLRYWESDVIHDSRTVADEIVAVIRGG